MKCSNALGFCMKHYKRFKKYGDSNITVVDRDDGSDTDRFHKKYITEPNSGCWLWIASLNNKGYGRIMFKTGKQLLAHRFSYILSYGEIPQGLNVCHKCDTPSCVNPDHLFLSDQAGNIRDMIKKGRMPKGEKHRLAKLTNTQAEEIRNLQIPYKDIANIYGVSRATVGSIKRMETY